MLLGQQRDRSVRAERLNIGGQRVGLKRNSHCALCWQNDIEIQRIDFFFFIASHYYIPNIAKYTEGFLNPLHVK